MALFVFEEAKRCLQCKKPKCKEGCPVNTPVNEVIKMLLNGNIITAGEILFRNNPLSVVCSLICPHEKQCQGHCVLNKQGIPVQIGSIENYISDYYLNFIDPEVKKNNKKKVAIIGSGPAGITISFILASKGYDITIFEAHDKIGGVLRYGIPEFRLSKDILQKLKNKILSHGIIIRPNTLIGQDLTVDNLFRDGYKAIFIGTGVWKSKSLGIKGEALGHVHYAIDYLKNPDVYNLGNKLCVIGAGNVAIDVARTALRHRIKEVYILARRGPEDLSAESVEVEYAKIDGVKFEYFKAPVEILEEGVKFIKTKVIKNEGKEDELIEIEGSEGLFLANSVIIASGQGPRANIVSTTEGIKATENGLVATDKFGHTTRDGVFAAGDVVTGAKTVVGAVKFSKIVAQAIDDYVSKNCCI